MQNKTTKRPRGGQPKDDPRRHRISATLSDAELNRYNKLLQQSRLPSAEYIRSRTLADESDKDKLLADIRTMTQRLTDRMDKITGGAGDDNL